MISQVGNRRCFLQLGPFTEKFRALLCWHLRRGSFFPPFSLRFNTTLSSVKSRSKLPVKYPERLLIYNSGTGRAVFIGCLKLTTIFVFGFFCLIVAPAHYYADDKPVWMTGLVLVSGIIPMVFVMYTTAPFVTYIHLRLPEYARQSRHNLLRYSRHLHRNAVIDITTLSILGRPRVSRLVVSNLYPIASRFGIANYARDAKDEELKRPWWAARPIERFAVLGGRGRPREEGVWDDVVRSIKRHSDETDKVRGRKLD